MKHDHLYLPLYMSLEAASFLELLQDSKFPEKQEDKE